MQLKRIPIESEEGQDLIDRCLFNNFVLINDYKPPTLGLVINSRTSADGEYYDGLEITTFDSGYPHTSNYTLGFQLTKISDEKAIEHLSEAKKSYDPELQKGSYAGAIAARRQYNLQQMIETLHTKPNPSTFINDPKIRICCDYYKTGTGLFVIEARYLEDGGWMGDGFGDNVRYEAIRIYINRGRETDPTKFTEDTVKEMVKELYPKGFGSIVPEIPSKRGNAYQSDYLGEYTVFEVPPSAVSMIEDFSEITLKFNQPNFQR